MNPKLTREQENAHGLYSEDVNRLIANTSYKPKDAFLVVVKCRPHGVRPVAVYVASLLFRKPGDGVKKGGKQVASDSIAEVGSFYTQAVDNAGLSRLADSRKFPGSDEQRGGTNLAKDGVWRERWPGASLDAMETQRMALRSIRDGQARTEGVLLGIHQTLDKAREEAESTYKHRQVSTLGAIVKLKLAGDPAESEEGALKNLAELTMAEIQKKW